MLFGASLAALGLGALAYLGDASRSLLPIRLFMVFMMPIVTVGGGFLASQMRQAATRK